MTRRLQNGELFVWFSGAAVTLLLMSLFGLLALVGLQGFYAFWPGTVAQFTGDNVMPLLGELVDEQEQTISTPAELKVKRGNRDLYGDDFQWIKESDYPHIVYNTDAITIERMEWGNFYGIPVALKDSSSLLSASDSQFQKSLATHLEAALLIRAQLVTLEKTSIGEVSDALERLRLKEKHLESERTLTPALSAAMAEEKSALELRAHELELQAETLRGSLEGKLIVREIGGQEITIPLSEIVRYYFPNQTSFLERLGIFSSRVGEFLLDDPRESNTAGGVFPAIFGTVMMVLLMTIFVLPLGVIAAIYLREYANQNWFSHLIRIAVNNLAGIPSIVFGVFGLGFFIYVVGGNIDRLFYSETLPTPTYGTGGILWASLTLALLTLPTVIVATEEGLATLPAHLREASYALGATKFETIWRVILPSLAPSILTGLILAVARAAGEVAPLMITGVVKLAPTLPFDGQFPYFHFDRKFMHLGFHIYDVGFQSPNVDASRPIVYATTVLLLLIVLILNLAAIRARNVMRKKLALSGV